MEVKDFRTGLCQVQNNLSGDRKGNKREQFRRETYKGGRYYGNDEL